VHAYFRANVQVFPLKWSVLHCFLDYFLKYTVFFRIIEIDMFVKNVCEKSHNFIQIIARHIALDFMSWIWPEGNRKTERPFGMIGM